MKYYYCIGWASYWCGHAVSKLEFLGPLYPYWLYNKFMRDSYFLSEKYDLEIWVEAE